MLSIYNVGNSFLIPLLRLFRKKVVISVDGVEWRRKKFGVLGSMWMHLSEKLTKWFAPVIVVDSLKVGEYYKNHYDAETVYIPYGSNIIECPKRTGILDKFGLEHRKYILFVGRFIPEKGIDKLLAAYSQIRTDLPLVVVGDNPYDSDYVESLKSQAPPGTIFTGAVYGDEMTELYANSYLFVSPSELEGTSPALLEAMGAGTCVVVNGIPEQLETIADAGVYYKVNDLQDLTRKVQELIDNPEIRDEFAAKAIKRVEKYYRWDRVLDYYENLLAQTAGIELPARSNAEYSTPKEALHREKAPSTDTI
ncbi:MAG TPA: glycosyltransferase [candidate division Zixibacteria bacterium]|nr:glycosyltransferase [candidate division Zixibacteria bacterium]